MKQTPTLRPSSLTRNSLTGLAVLRIFIIICFTVPLVLSQLAVGRFLKNWWAIPGLWHKFVSKTLGLKVTVIGEPVKDRTVLFVSNHISWQDPMTLGPYLKNSSFVAKFELSKDPIFGFLSKVQKTVFVKRNNRMQSKQQAEEMAARVRAGDSLAFFPEGTSTLGKEVQPFKSSLFAVAEQVAAVSDGHLLIQPITLCYTHINGIPLSRARRQEFGFVGDMKMIPQMLMAMNRWSVHATIEFHEPISMDHAPTRKDMAVISQQIIAEGLERANRHDHSLGPRSRGHED